MVESEHGNYARLDELERLRAENERLRKDAKRYRGLRDDFAWTLSASGNDARLTIHVPGVNPLAIGQTECEFNAAIDAAMAFAAEQAA